MDMENVKQIFRDAGTALSRAVQFTEEKLGKAEKTELDPNFEQLVTFCDSTKQNTETILKNMEFILNSNPGMRVENLFFLDKKKSGLSSLEYLGLAMTEAGNEFGPDTAYGSALIKVGNIQQTLGLNQREFIKSTNDCFVNPMNKYLETDMKTVVKERSLLEKRRLDLDACKTRVRKTRMLATTKTKQDDSGPTTEELIEKAELDLKIAQEEFDRQAEITKLLMEGVPSAHPQHLQHLLDFVDTQAAFYLRCHESLMSLQSDLSGFPTEQDNIATLSPDTPALGRIQQAKVITSQEPRDSHDLRLSAGEIISIDVNSDIGSNYFIGKKIQKGKVYKSNVRLLNQG
ncbi:BAR domain,Arfaptin homology (AH) domain/BAR domain [Cinara cedri]|uniref:BAR domain,Arfaptin homology (AH) domain/BAR domain n=1 Tax=Cinara cedri TaxID=506608 RepID=A0A5E4NJ06_9HEMI|nr:BAR domain,Arfaptin homology (AH) domain/BAR domain [Cinara cedri]